MTGESDENDGQPHPDYPSTVSRDTAREHVEWWVNATGGHGRDLHLPEPGSTRSDHEPCCEKTTWEGNVTDSDISVFPPGYRGICGRCLDQASDQGESDTDGESLPGDSDTTKYGRSPEDVLKEANLN